jgi:hypothetical protein
MLVLFVPHDALSQSKDKLHRCKLAIEKDIGSEVEFAKEIKVVETKKSCRIRVIVINPEKLNQFQTVRVQGNKSPDHLSSDIGNPIKLAFEFEK